MVEHDLLVCVRVDELVVEFAVEVCVDGGQGVGFGEDVGEGDVFILLGFAFLGEAFGAEDGGVGEGGVPGAEEDVVLVGGVSLGFREKRVGRGVHTSMSSAVMYFTSPSSETFCLTSSVRATGEKTAREPFWRRTMVPRPPIFMRPKREKGTERVVMVRGMTSRITMTSAGFEGTSLEVMLMMMCEI